LALSQTDVAVMDFSKAFDTVPHRRLLYKLDWYGIRGQANNWIQSFLSNRTQRVVVDGFYSQEAAVTSGVPQGSVLGPALFLVYINDLPEYTKHSKVRLFADDCILYKPVSKILDCQKLQEDLAGLERWEKDWLMRFNVSKCSIMSISNKKPPSLNFSYKLHGQTMERETDSKYLGITLESDLKWHQHIRSICNKANRTLGVLRRNLRINSRDVKERAYFSLVRPQIEYSNTVWDPHQKQDINELDKVQRRAARYVTNRFHNRSSVNSMLDELGWESLKSRRIKSKMCMAYKAFNGLVALPITEYISFSTIRTRSSAHPYAVIMPQPRLNTYKYSFIPSFGTYWNVLPVNTVTAPTYDLFKAGLESFHY